MSYRHQPAYRLNHENGPARTIDLLTDLTYVAGPVRCTVKYTAVTKLREDVNQKIRARRDGFRVDVEMDFDVGEDLMPDHRLIAAIASALMDPAQTVEMTLDRVTWREVALVKYSGPEPFRGKTIAGARFHLDVRCVELVDEVPPIEGGSW